MGEICPRELQPSAERRANAEALHEDGRYSEPEEGQPDEAREDEDRDEKRDGQEEDDRQ